MESQASTLSWLIGLAVFLAVASSFLSSGGAVPRVRAKALLTSNELAFYRRLRQAAGQLNVAPQVAMGALLQTAIGENRSDRTRARNRFDRKIVDFVLFDDDGRVHLIVELDDRTHIAGKDDLRDKMTASAGYKTLRLRAAEARTSDAIAAAIADVLLPPSGTGYSKSDGWTLGARR